MWPAVPELSGQQMPGGGLGATELLESIRVGQAAFIAHGDPGPVFASLLRALVSLTESEFGFVDEVLRDEDGTPYKLSLALSNIAWSPETEELHTKLQARQLEFRNLNNLAGLPALTGEPLISNDAANDPHAGGLPPGHPPIRTFMGLAMHFGGEVVGVAGVANRAGGYDEGMARFLEPFLNTCASIIHAMRAKARQDETTRAQRASEERLRLAMKATNDVIWDWDIVQDLQTWSAAGATVFGWSDIIAHPQDCAWWVERVHPDDRERVAAGFHAAVADPARSHWRDEYRFRKADGSCALVLDRGYVMRDQDGRAVRMIGAMQDVTERRRTELALREAQLWQDAAVRAGKVGLWDWDLKTNRVQYSTEWKRQIGHEGHEIGDGFDEWQGRVHRDDLEPTLGHIRRTLAEGRDHWKAEFRFRHKDGSYRWILAQAAVVKDDSGQPIRTLGSHVDITERKEAEQALRASEAKYRQLVELAQEGIWAIDDQARTTFVNPRMAEMLGRTVAEMQGRSLYEFMDAAHVATAQENFRRRQAGVVERHEFQFRCRDGAPLLAELAASPLKDTSGRVVGALAVVADVTERRKAEAAQRRLVAAIEQAGEMIVITDPAGTIQYVNAAFERVTGYARDEALGRNPRILKSGRHDQAFYQELWRTITAGRVWQGRFVNRRKDGTLYDEQAVLAPVRDAQGRIMNFVAVKRDITEELSLAEQLRQAQKMEAIGQLAAGVAHDFNNVLTALLAYVGVAQRAAALDSDVSESLEGIENLAVHAAGITKSLLMFSGRAEAELKPVDLGALLGETAKLLRHIVPRAIALRITSPTGEPLWVRGDRTQLQQVIMNLAINARDAMPDGGQLNVAVAPLPDAPTGPEDASAVPRPAVCLCVGDTGCGMSPETQAQIFEPFFTTKPRGRGTGLGLPIVHGIVKEHGGHIDVRSALGWGTAFRVILPRIAAPPAEPAAGPSQAEPCGRGELVLLAEDDPYVRALLVTELERLGFTVAAAADGDELMRLHEARRPALRLLVLDFDLPRQTGGECLRRIRRGGDRVPAILISGAAESRRRLDDPEVYRLHKPFGLPQFAAAVHRALASVPQSEVAL
jgi:PAS domain S-box-containing protein